MPVLPSSLLEPTWAQCNALLTQREEFDPGHPLGCHRRRIPDRIVFEHVVQALVHGSGCERISSPGCSDRSIRRRVKLWAASGLARKLHRIALDAYNRVGGAFANCVALRPADHQRAARIPDGPRDNRWHSASARTVPISPCGASRQHTGQFGLQQSARHAREVPMPHRPESENTSRSPRKRGPV